MKINMWMILLTLVITGGLITACGSTDSSNEAREKQLEEYAAKHGLDVDVELDGKDGKEKIVLEQNAGGNSGVKTQAGKNLDLPKGFPEDVPIYPNLNIYGAAATPVGYSINALSEDDTDKISKFFSKEFSANGWSEAENSQVGPTMQRISFKKGTRIANVTILNNDSRENVVQIGVVDPPK